MTLPCILKAKDKYNKSAKGKIAKAKYYQAHKKEIIRKRQQAYKENPEFREAERSRGRATQFLRNVRLRICEECGATPQGTRIDCHHIDVNPLNNSIENLKWLCSSCHKKTHDRLRKGLL